MRPHFSRCFDQSRDNGVVRLLLDEEREIVIWSACIYKITALGAGTTLLTLRAVLSFISFCLPTLDGHPVMWATKLFPRAIPIHHHHQVTSPLFLPSKHMLPVSARYGIHILISTFVPTELLTLLTNFYP